jgi:hypothetical protein
MAKLLLGLLIGIIISVPVTAHAWTSFSHWKDSSDYYVDKHKDGDTTCYVAADQRNNGFPPVSISCVRTK